MIRGFCFHFGFYRSVLLPNPAIQSQIIQLQQRLLSTAIILGFMPILNKIIVWIHSKKTYRISDYDSKNY